MWVTPAGTVDEGGVMQPSYLNFDTTLLAAPLNNEMSVSHSLHTNIQLLFIKATERLTDCCTVPVSSVPSMHPLSCCPPALLFL